jgi:hypothetical protein
MGCGVMKGVGGAYNADCDGPTNSGELAGFGGARRGVGEEDESDCGGMKGDADCNGPGSVINSGELDSACEDKGVKGAGGAYIDGPTNSGELAGFGVGRACDCMRRVGEEDESDCGGMKGDDKRDCEDGVGVIGMDHVAVETILSKI